MENNKALIVIDMQEAYVGKQNKRARFYNAEKLIYNINERIKQYQLNSDIVIYIQNVAKGKKSDIVKDLIILSENIFEKNKASCFGNQDLLSFIDENKISTIELAGVDGNYCVGMSALEARKLGIAVKMNLQCIGTGNQEKFKNTKRKLMDAGVEILID
jgi:nicotinamidase-related amidase